MTLINRSNGELVIPSSAGTLIQTNTSGQGIRVCGSATTAPGLNSSNIALGTSAKQIQFYNDGNLTAVMDVSGCYVNGVISANSINGNAPTIINDRANIGIEINSNNSIRINAQKDRAGVEGNTNNIINLCTPNAINAINSISDIGWTCGSTVFSSSPAHNGGGGVGITFSNVNNNGYIYCLEPGASYRDLNILTKECKWFVWNTQKMALSAEGLYVNDRLSANNLSVNGLGIFNNYMRPTMGKLAVNNGNEYKLFGIECNMFTWGLAERIGASIRFWNVPNYGVDPSARGDWRGSEIRFSTCLPNGPSDPNNFQEVE